MGIKLNLGAVEGGGDFEPLEGGIYTGTIFEINQKVGQTSNKPYLEFVLKITQEGPYKGRQLWSNYSLQPQALFGLKGVLAAFGYNVDGELDFEPNELLGREVSIGVAKKQDRQYGKPEHDFYVNDVTSIKPAGGAAAAAASW